MRNGTDLLVLALGWILVVTVLVITLTGCTATTKVMCPRLSPPPASITDALETASRQDPNAASWTIGLEKHYSKLDACQ